MRFVHVVREMTANKGGQSERRELDSKQVDPCDHVGGRRDCRRGSVAVEHRK